MSSVSRAHPGLLTEDNQPLSAIFPEPHARSCQMRCGAEQSRFDQWNARPRLAGAVQKYQLLGVLQMPAPIGLNVISRGTPRPRSSLQLLRLSHLPSPKMDRETCSGGAGPFGWGASPIGTEPAIHTQHDRTTGSTRQDPCNEGRDSLESKTSANHFPNVSRAYRSSKTKTTARTACTTS